MEIEKKFKLKETEAKQWLHFANSVPGHTIKEIVQGYVVVENDMFWRIRLTKERKSGEEKAFWTFKKATQSLMEREEVESQMDVVKAKELLAQCIRQVEKVRHVIPYGNGVFELDVFGGEHEGLVVLEREMQEKDEVIQWPPLPRGEDVTESNEYQNVFLACESAIGKKTRKP